MARGVFGNLGIKGKRTIADSVKKKKPAQTEGAGKAPATRAPAGSPSGSQLDKPKSQAASPLGGDLKKKKKSLVNANSVSRQGNSLLG